MSHYAGGNAVNTDILQIASTIEHVSHIMPDTKRKQANQPKEVDRRSRGRRRLLGSSTKQEKAGKLSPEYIYRLFYVFHRKKERAKHCLQAGRMYGKNARCSIIAVSTIIA